MVAKEPIQPLKAARDELDRRIGFGKKGDLSPVHFHVIVMLCSKLQRYLRET